MRQETLLFATQPCSFGFVLVASSERGVCCIFLGDEPAILLAELHHRFPGATLREHAEECAQVVAFVESPTADLLLPLDVRGTFFQQRVWQALRQIPRGSTASYTQIAQMIDSPKAVRAVAGACAANSICLAIPCHRIIRSDGKLSGYRWGAERKRALLAREAR